MKPSFSTTRIEARSSGPTEATKRRMPRSLDTQCIRPRAASVANPDRPFTRGGEPRQARPGSVADLGEQWAVIDSMAHLTDNRQDDGLNGPIA